LFFCASQHPLEQDPAALYQRFLKIKPPEKTIPEVAFFDLLPEGRAAFTRARLEGKNAEINTDTLPITFYYNLILWSRFTASGAGEFLAWLKDLDGWPYGVPAFFAAWILFFSLKGQSKTHLERFRQNTALFSLASFGFVTMAAQLVILLSFQMKIGVIFSRIAVINGLFMAGLVLGAAWLGGWLSRRGTVESGLIGIHLAMGIFCLILPQLLQADPGTASQLPYHALAFVTGILGGSAFPLGVSMVHDRQQVSAATSGLVHAWDHWGGALGAWVAGLIMIPLTGTTTTMRLLAFIILLSIGALSLIQSPGLRARIPLGKTPSYPWQGWVRTLLIVTLSVGVLTALTRHHGQEKQMTFNSSLLASVSGSQHFQTITAPWLHYVGRNDTLEPDTVSLSSLTVADDIRGYAGPIHLLVSAEKNGKIRGAHLIYSQETPAYIHDMGPWLQRFKGIAPDDPRFTVLGMDGLSGATITRNAALKTIQKTALHGLHQAFGHELPSLEKTALSWPPLSFWAALTILILAVMVYFRNKPREMLLLEIAAVLILGFAFNLPWTELDLVNGSLGHVGGWENHQAWWLLGGFALLAALLAGPIHCGLVCPFGALQSLFSRLGVRLGFGRSLNPRVERLGLFFKFILLAGVLVAVWVSGETR
ncbi:MAG TPA: FMN-binding protein, partial [Magnetococcales bacterium]|nr:FMN-binding protein [Magnetococcales bacterium]